MFLNVKKSLTKYNETWSRILKVTKRRKKDSCPMFYDTGNKSFISNIKSCIKKITSNVENISNKQPKERSNFICQPITVNNSVLKSSKTYYPKMFLKECKNRPIEKMINLFITVDLEKSDDSD